MRAHLLRFVGTLRAHAIDVSPAEVIDAVAAVAAVGIERESLREALAATLVKDEGDRPTFDALFDRAFPLLRAAPRGGGARRRRAAGDAAAGSAGGGTARGDAAGRGTAPREGASPEHAPGDDATTRRRRESPAPDAERMGDAGTAGVADDARDLRPHDADAGAAAPAADAGVQAVAGSRRARRAALLTKPFAEMTANDLPETRQLAAELGARLRARLARRERAARRGRLDLRRTLRAAASTGGIALRLRRRARRPGRPDLVALCDVSGSVAAVSELLLGLLAPLARHFRRVHTFAYVDRLCAVSLEQGHLAPEGTLDLWARSDFGRVLADLDAHAAGLLGPTTLLLVLGDARNNRLPPRLDLWQAATARVGRVVWLVPEPQARWNTGDSVLARYAAAADAVVECVDLRRLAAAVRDALA